MKYFTVTLVLLFICGAASSHTIDFQLGKTDSASIFFDFLVSGFEHILPLGLDHILFIACMFFMAKNFKQLLVQSSIFTLAHSITLGLSLINIIHPPGMIVEPLIALSIVAMAVENLRSTEVRSWKLGLIFCFGLVHGMGFAGALADQQLPTYAFAEALTGFNIGVELGQIVVIGVLYCTLKIFLSAKPWYRKWILVPVNLWIAIFAAILIFERI